MKKNLLTAIDEQTAEAKPAQGKMCGRIAKLESKMHRAEAKLAKTEAKLEKRRAKLAAAREEYEAALAARSHAHEQAGGGCAGKCNGNGEADSDD